MRLRYHFSYLSELKGLQGMFDKAKNSVSLDGEATPRVSSQFYEWKAVIGRSVFTIDKQ